MDIMTSIAERVDRLAVFAELAVERDDLPRAVLSLSDRSVIEAARELAALAADIGRLQALIAGVAARRSTRDSGQAGLAATLGHRTPTALVQAISGSTSVDAGRQVRVGTALLEGIREPADSPAAEDHVWHESLGESLLGGRLSPAQHDAIRRGLGEPGDSSAEARGAWAMAAERLASDAPTLTVEDLGARARTLRDTLDKAGAEERFARRYEKRSFRTWIDADGQHHGRVMFDDEMALWVTAMTDAALRPRRGGPRFRADDERAEEAARLADDPRTNDQLRYDLLMSTLRAGALADAADVFGARQPGVRLLVVAAADGTTGARDSGGRLPAIGHAEDGGHAVPGSLVDRAVCESGSRRVVVDGRGNPLDVGHELRLYTPRQRIALAARDGGCASPTCSAPASYCEAHHIDHVAEGGRTDIDRGILLCRHHHLLLHNRGWRIRRERLGPFVLHPPPASGGEPVALVSKAAWKWAWAPPPPPDRGSWRAA